MSVPLDQMQLPDMPMLQPVSGPTSSQGLGAFLGSPQATGMAAALLQAGGPSRLPVGLGQALGSAITGGQQYAGQDRENQMKQMQLALMRLRLMSSAPGSGTGGQ